MALSKDTINTLEAERAQIEQRIKHNRGLIPQVRQQISTDERAIKALNTFITSMNGSQTNLVKRAPKRDWKAILDAVRQMLFTEQPRKKADILTRLEGAGLLPNTAANGQKLMALMMADPRFKSVGFGLYALAEWEERETE